MSDLKLFRILEDGATELEGSAAVLERPLQNLIEKHMSTLLGVRFLASEYSTGETHRGRIDSLGIDEDHCPVIVEYKRKTDENVINQGLFYLDWLLDHKAEFQLLVQKRFGQEEAEKIEWTGPRLLCIANEFTRYDEYAVQQINRNIELIRYKKYDDALLLLELVNASTATDLVETHDSSTTLSMKNSQKSVTDNLTIADQDTKDLFKALQDYLTSLGDDVQMKTLKFYVAFRRFKNFACVEVRNRNKQILIYTKVDPTSIELKDGFTRDVREVGHYGTGELEIVITNLDDLEKAKPLLKISYDAN